MWMRGWSTPGSGGRNGEAPVAMTSLSYGSRYSRPVAMLAHAHRPGGRGRSRAPRGRCARPAPATRAGSRGSAGAAPRGPRCRRRCGRAGRSWRTTRSRRARAPRCRRTRRARRSRAAADMPPATPPMMTTFMLIVARTGMAHQWWPLRTIFIIRRLMAAKRQACTARLVRARTVFGRGERGLARCCCRRRPWASSSAGGVRSRGSFGDQQPARTGLGLVDEQVVQHRLDPVGAQADLAVGVLRAAAGPGYFW